MAVRVGSHPKSGTGFDTKRFGAGSAAGFAWRERQAESASALGRSRFAHQTASKFASAEQRAREGTLVAREWTEKTSWGWIIFSPGADKGE